MTATIALLALFCLPPHSGAQQHPRPLRIQLVEPAAPAGEAAVAAFSAFYRDYSQALAKAIPEPGPWTFIVALKSSAVSRTPRIVVTARGGNLSVEVGAIRPFDAHKHVRKLVSRSVAISRNAYLSSLAAGDAASAANPWPTSAGR